MDPQDVFVVQPFSGEKVERPAFAGWLFEYDIDLREAGALLGVSHTQVQNICYPFSDPRRRPPKDWLLERIVTLTRGEIGGRHFIAPHLFGRAQAVTAAAAAGG